MLFAFLKSSFMTNVIHGSIQPIPAYIIIIVIIYSPNAIKTLKSHDYAWQRGRESALTEATKNINKLKLINRLCVTRWTPPDYWQTDNSNGLVMVICNYHRLNSASRVLISTCSAPLLQTGERKQLSLFDLDLWPTTLTYNHRLAKVKVDPHAKNQGQRSNGSNRRGPTDKRTDTHTHGRYQKYYLPCYAVDKNRATTASSSSSCSFIEGCHTQPNI